MGSQQKCELIESYHYIATTNLSKYEGEWIAVVGKEVVAADKNIKKAYALAKNKYPEKEPLMDKVYKEGILIV